MKKPSWVAADPLATAAAALLGIVFAWGMALSLLVPAPPALALLADAQKRDAHRQVVFIVPSGDEARARIVAGARADLPRLPLRVISLPPDERAGVRGTPFDRRLWSLLRSYGYDTLPMLLVLDEQGRVVKVSDL